MKTLFALVLLLAITTPIFAECVTVVDQYGRQVVLCDDRLGLVPGGGDNGRGRVPGQ